MGFEPINWLIWDVRRQFSSSISSSCILTFKLLAITSRILTNICSIISTNLDASSCSTTYYTPNLKHWSLVSSRNQICKCAWILASFGPSSVLTASASIGSTTSIISISYRAGKHRISRNLKSSSWKNLLGNSWRYHATSRNHSLASVSRYYSTITSF